jgi:hypothetical protein
MNRVYLFLKSAFGGQCSVEAALAAASLANRMAPREIGASQRRCHLKLSEESSNVVDSTLSHATAACAKKIAGCGSAVNSISINLILHAFGGVTGVRYQSIDVLMNLLLAVMILSVIIILKVSRRVK